MYSFSYSQPGDLAEALAMLKGNDGSTCVMAGGTDLLLRFRSGRCRASRVVSLDLPELKTIEADSRQVQIGASVSLKDIVNQFSGLEAPVGMIAETAASVGACQTRNLATIAGNFCTGNASSDMATALLAVGAYVVIASADGQRRLPLDQFFVKNRVTALSPEEIVTKIVIPRKTGLTYGACFQKVGKRRGHVIAALNAAAVVGVDESGIIRDAALAAGTLAPCPVRLYRSEAAIFDHAVTEELLQEVSEIMLTEICPRDSLRASRQYRLQVAPGLLRRVICRSLGREE